MSTATRAELHAVCRNLYDALLTARPHLARRLDVVAKHGTDRLYAVVATELDKVDAALADAADHLESDGQ